MAASAITIRPVRPEEHSELGELTVRVYRDVLESTLEGYADVLRGVDARLASGCEVLVAVVGGRVVGGVTYVSGPGPYAQMIAADEAEIRMLVVDPEAQGQGVGAALVGACVARARAAGKHTLALGTMPAMEAAQRLYTRLGFRRALERHHDVPGGPSLVTYAMETGRQSFTQLSIDPSQPVEAEVVARYSNVSASECSFGAPQGRGMLERRHHPRGGREGQRSGPLARCLRASPVE